MATYTQIIYHIVYATKERRLSLTPEIREDLFRYVWGVLKEHKCHLYRINAVDDHMHMLINLHQEVKLSDLIKNMKVASTKWLRRERGRVRFPGWQSGYGAFTHSFADKSRLIEYIKYQEEHHRAVSFKDELRALLKEAGVDFDEKYFH